MGHLYHGELLVITRPGIPFVSRPTSTTVPVVITLVIEVVDLNGFNPFRCDLAPLLILRQHKKKPESIQISVPEKILKYIKIKNSC